MTLSHLEELRKQREITVKRWEKIGMLTSLMLDEEGKQRQLLIDRFLKIKKIKENGKNSNIQS